MYSVTRNSSDNKKDFKLITFINDEVAIHVDNFKKLFGYSEKTKRSEIINKISKSNLRTFGSFNGANKYVEEHYITYEGAKEFTSKIKHKDKIQNAKLALNLIAEAIEIKLCCKDDKKVKVKPINRCNDLTSDEMRTEICDLLGCYNKHTKHKWVQLYDELDKMLNESIRISCANYKRTTGKSTTILNYIQYHTSLLPVLYDIAIDKFGA